jgi:two-component system, OmpR family, response regulator RegX3
MLAVGGNIRVLVVEDEESYRQALSSGLQNEGFDVDIAPNGIEGLRLFADRPPDIVLLDMLLPGMHGMEVCRRMRTMSQVPIVMVSAVDAELDVVLGLELGAADYVTKPFRLRELVARMQAILRRVAPPPLPFLHPSARNSPSPALDPGPRPGEIERRSGVAFGNVSVDYVRREVTVGGTQTHLSRREFDLLAVLLSPARRVRTRDELIDLLWPDRYLSDSRTLDTHVHRLRAKLEPDPGDPQFIVTVRGVGFRIDPDGTHPAPPHPDTDGRRVEPAGLGNRATCGPLRRTADTGPPRGVGAG